MQYYYDTEFTMIIVNYFIHIILKDFLDLFVILYLNSNFNSITILLPNKHSALKPIKFLVSNY